LYLVEQPPHYDLLRLSLSTGDLSAFDGLFPSGLFNFIILFFITSSFLLGNSPLKFYSQPKFSFVQFIQMAADLIFSAL
jgi:hypothetical protein